MSPQKFWGGGEGKGDLWTLQGGVPREDKTLKAKEKVQGKGSGTPETVTDQANTKPVDSKTPGRGASN